MTTYNLITRFLREQREDKECFCILGIFAEEKMGAGAAKRLDYEPFRKPEYAEDLGKMATFLSPLRDDSGEWDPLTEAHYEVIWRANDRTRKVPETERYEPEVPAEKLKEALALVGVEVELIDLRME